MVLAPDAFGLPIAEGRQGREGQGQDQKDEQGHDQPVILGPGQADLVLRGPGDVRRALGGRRGRQN